MGGLNDTYGAVFVAICISAVLYGVTILQVFSYFRDYPQDRFWDKLGVCWLWVLDSLHIAFCIYAMYWYLVINFGVFAELAVIHWSFEAAEMLNTIVIFSVQGLYIVRVWKLDAAAGVICGRRQFRPISILVGVALCVALATALECCYEISRLKTFASGLEPDHLWIMYYSLSAASCIDIVVAASLCYLLSKCRTGFRNTDSLVKCLMFYTINTGLVTSMCSLGAVIMLAVLPTTYLTVAIQLLQVKLYVNSYLAMLNARCSLRRQRDDSPGYSISLPRSMVFHSPLIAGEMSRATSTADPGATIRWSNTRTGCGRVSGEVDLSRHVHDSAHGAYKSTALSRSDKSLVTSLDILPDSPSQLRNSRLSIDADRNATEARRPAINEV